MTQKEAPTPPDTDERAGPYRDFASFSELELERRLSSEENFDAGLFKDAVALVLGKIAGLGGREPGGSDDDHQ